MLHHRAQQVPLVQVALAGEDRQRFRLGDRRQVVEHDVVVRAVGEVVEGDAAVLAAEQALAGGS